MTRLFFFRSLFEDKLGFFSLFYVYLCNISTDDVSPNDLQRLQVGLLDLHKHMQPDCANQYCHYQRQQHVPNPIHPRQNRKWCFSSFLLIIILTPVMQ